MPTMTGGEALVASLKAQGVDTIFALPGVQLDWFFDALWAARHEIRVIHPRHEQAAAYMADGYARSTGRPGVCAVVPGPGLLNASAALATAYACNSPVVMLTGQVQSDLIDAGRGLLHEIPDQLGLARHLTKWAERAMRVEAIPGLVSNAFREAQSGRPRPVLVEVPPDILQASGEVTVPEAAMPLVPALDGDALERAARLLGAAKRPVIFSGGGVIASGASAELTRLAALLEAPVLASQNGRGAVSDADYHAQARIVASELMADADVVLAVGTRMLEPYTARWAPREDQPVVRIDIDPEEFDRIHSPAVAIQADAKAALASLLDLVPRYNAARPSRREELEELRGRAREAYDGVGPQADFGNAIRAAIPEDAIVVGEMTQVGYWANVAFPVYRPRTFLTPGYQGTLGCGFCIALGAKAGNPDWPVISISGDGGFGFQLQELSTMAAHRLGVVALVFNDSAYGNVQRSQRQQFNEHVIATDLHNPDFVKLADSFGVHGVRAATPAELRRELESALGRPEGTLIEVPMPPVPPVWGVPLPPRGKARP